MKEPPTHIATLNFHEGTIELPVRMYDPNNQKAVTRLKESLESAFNMNESHVWVAIESV